MACDGSDEEMAIAPANAAAVRNDLYATEPSQRTTPQTQIMIAHQKAVQALHFGLRQYR